MNETARLILKDIKINRYGKGKSKLKLIFINKLFYIIIFFNLTILINMYFREFHVRLGVKEHIQN